MNDARPHLTILTPIAPFPGYSGGAAHVRRTALGLASHYRVSLYTLAARPEWVRWGPLAGACDELSAFRPGPRGGGLLDPPAARAERSAELERHLELVWRQHPPDVVQIEYTTMAHYAPPARSTGALVVCTAHNVATLAQLQRARREKVPVLRLRRLLGALSLWRYERRVLRDYDLVITLSQADALALGRWLPQTPAVHIPAGLGVREQPLGGQEGVVLFVGSYLHPPNVEAALWLAREVWPDVQAVRPEARLVLAGRDPPAAVRALAGRGIEVPGTLADLAPLYEQAGVVAAAAFWGGGVRIKILEALAAGLPVVATPAAAAGLALEHEQNALLATDAAGFAEALLRLLGNGALRERIGRAGHALALAQHDTTRTARLLAGLYEGGRAGLGRGQRRAWPSSEIPPQV
jgi:glycosyltransferase involved in cell wall biosynthesis